MPLSDRAIEILGHARTLHDGALIFPGTSDQPLSDNTLSKLMRDAKAVGTPHGFRSALDVADPARDKCAVREAANPDRDIDMAFDEVDDAVG